MSSKSKSGIGFAVGVALIAGVFTALYFIKPLIADLGTLGLAFSAGIVAFVNPCAFALLPAYLSYFLGKSKDNSESGETLGNAVQGLKYGLAATLGFATVLGGIGVLVSIIGSQIKPYLPPFLLVVAPVLIVLGILWLLNKSELSSHKFLPNVKLPRSSFFLFGAAYALSSITCLFPVFLMIVLTAISSGGFFSGLSVFLVYTLGMSAMMILASITVALSKELLINNFKAITKYVKRIAGVILIAAGIYLLYYWTVSFGL